MALYVALFAQAPSRSVTDAVLSRPNGEFHVGHVTTKDTVCLYFMRIVAKPLLDPRNLRSIVAVPDAARTPLIEPWDLRSAAALGRQ